MTTDTTGSTQGGQGGESGEQGSLDTDNISPAVLDNIANNSGNLDEFVKAVCQKNQSGGQQ